MSAHMHKANKAPRPKKRGRAIARRKPDEIDLHSLVDLSTRWYYWEQDEHYRFTRLVGSVFNRPGIDRARYLGKTRWELDAVPVGDGGKWDAHKSVLAARQPFCDFLMRNVGSDGRVHYIATSGRPVFDENGVFRGYRGVSRNVTSRYWLDRRLAIEHGVTRILAETINPSEALSPILRVIGEALQWECGTYWEVDGDAGRLRCLATWRQPRTRVARFIAATERLSPLALDTDSFITRFASATQPAWIGNLADDAAFARALPARAAGLVAAFVVPVVAGGAVIGIMEFFGRDPYPLGNEVHKGGEYVGAVLGQRLQQKKAEEELFHFRTAIDMSPDLIYLIDPVVPRYLYVNDTACRVSGYAREEHLKLCPAAVAKRTPEELKRLYQEVIAKGAEGFTTESIVTARDGERDCFEAHRRAIRLGDKWVIVVVSRNVSERKRAERAASWQGRMYAALSAVNEAILHASSPEDLYRRVCDAAVHGGKFVNAAILIPDAGTTRVRVAAATGVGTEKLRRLHISVDADTPEGRGLVGTAFRTHKPCVSDDHRNDARTLPWRHIAEEMGVGSAAALPLVRDERAFGVLLLDAAEKHAFNGDVVALLERIAENTAFALDNFEREAKRRRAELATQRYARMYAALGAANEALLRAKSPDELYQRVCAAAVDGGGFVVGGVVLTDPASPWGTLVAATGPGAAALRDARISFDESCPEGQGVIGVAFRTQRPCVSNDYMHDERSRPWRGVAAAAGVGSATALPLIRGGRSVGAMMFYASEKNAFDDEIVKLLERMTENVSFALDNFEREAERRRAEEAQQRATRMYAALSATNEAILHAKSPDELYQQVCEAIVQGRSFLTAIVFTVAPDSDFATVAAAASKTDAGLLRNIQWSIDPSKPEAQSLSAIAYATRQPCISNDYLNDARTRYWHKQCERGGVRAAASLPIVRGERSVGVLVIYSRERNAFDDETVNLMRHISKNVAFALDNFEHEAERTRSAKALRASEEKYRHVLETMYEGYFEVDVAGNYTFFNDALCKIQGYSREEMMGMNFRQYTDPETSQRVYAIYNEIYRTGASSQLTEWAFIRKDGTRGIWESSPQVIRDADGKAIGFRGLVRDVTLRRETEERLRASEEKYRTILENMTEGYFECDLAGNFTFFNEAERRLIGYDRDELMGMNYRRYMDAETAEKVRRIYHQIYRTGIPAELEEYNMIRKDGGTTTIQASVQLIRDAAGKPIGFRGVTRDVTRRRKAEIALRASEEKHRTILESMYDSYFEVDLAGNYTFFNNALCRLHGRSREELTGLNYRAYMDEATAARVYEAHNRIYRTGEATELLDFTIIRKDGSHAVCEAMVQLKTEADGKPTGFRGVVRDVTRRRREEQLLALEHAVTRALASDGSTRACITEVTRIICESERWPSGGCWMYHDASAEFHLLAGWTDPTTNWAADFRRTYVRLPMDTLIGEVYRTGEPRWAADTTGDPRPAMRLYAERTGERSSFLCPVMAGGKTLGVLAFGRHTPQEPDERLLRTANIIGNQIGQFLQRKQAETVLRESEARFRALTQLSSDWYWEQDAEFRFCRIESQRTDTEASRQKLLGEVIWETGFEVDAEGGWEAYRAVLLAHQPFRDIVMHRELPSGEIIYISVSGEPIFDRAKRFTGYRGVSREITEQKVAEDRIEYLATHDSLTELPNRVMFSQLLNLAIESARRYGRQLAVLFIDLDRFKVINDTLGHEAGDQLLQETGRRLKHTLRASDVIARLGGDEFVVLVQELTEPSQAATIARKVLSSVIKPIVLMGQECRVTASIGISTYPGDAEDEQSLMKNADMAMYRAKEEGKNNFQFYSHDIKNQSLERLTLETNLRRALERQEFSLHYQPKQDLRTGAITGVEALLRWNDPELGVVSPAQFIPLAEETGLIVPIGQWVLKTACAQNVAWQRARLPAIRLAVNLSARQFADEHLLPNIAATLEETGLAPELLELEITEGMVMHDPERARRLLEAIKRLGVRVAIDDFGTGYSSLAQIKRFPIDILKVDRSFIRDIPHDAEDNAITQAIMAMGKTLSLTVVAEGVETREQADFLRSRGCDEIQGYYFSKPLPPEQCAALLQSCLVA